MAWIKISSENGGVFAQEIDNPVAVVSVDELNAELLKLQANLAEVAEDVAHKDKEYESFVNSERQKRRDVYAQRLREVQDKINELSSL